MSEHIDNTSLEMAEDLCVQNKGYHLMSLNSHEEQRQIHNYYNRLVQNYDADTIYLFISLKIQVAYSCNKAIVLF